MPEHPIVRLGHPALRTPAEPVDLDQLASPETQTLIDDLFETMTAAGGVGLAAPQIGVELQIFVYAAVDGDRIDEEPDLRVLINPGVEPMTGEMVYDWEGCLSIPDLRGLVPRHPEVQIYAHDRRGRRITERVKGYTARIVQHEFDHLNGIVFLDRMRDLRSLSHVEEWKLYMTVGADDAASVG